MKVGNSVKRDRPSFWEQPDQVEKFSAREPDHRLQELAAAFEAPSSVSVLDLGCAGGRNTEYLVREGFDVRALDASTAMVEETRRRLRPLLGRKEARRRVLVGEMSELGAFADATFELVVALGVYHNARGRGEWEEALGETARVLEDGGLLLVSNFAPGTDLTGEGLEPVAGSDRLYRGAPSGVLYLLPADELDREMGRHGLHPLEPTETVEVDSDPGRRITVHGLYRKGG
jgi:SAM-dependent methyltransferase